MTEHQWTKRVDTSKISGVLITDEWWVVAQTSGGASTFNVVDDSYMFNAPPNNDIICGPTSAIRAVRIASR
jgi:hypothetical protein